MYASELWYPNLIAKNGIKSYADKEFFKYNNEIENFQFKHLKRLLGISDKTANLAVLGETGQYPLYIYAIKQCISYWFHIMLQDGNSIVKNAYNELYNMNREGYRNWVTVVQDILTNNNDILLQNVWDNQGIRNVTKSKIMKIGNEIEKIYKLKHEKKWVELVNSEEPINNNTTDDSWVRKNKLRTYKIFKTEYKLEGYLETNMNIKHRKALTQIRTSSHELNIEIGRRFNIPPNKRICKLCKTGVEDEYHFLCACPSLRELRLKYFNLLVIIPELDGRYDKAKTLKTLFDNTKNFAFHRIVGDFCFEMFELRKEMLKEKQNPLAT